MGGCFPVLVAFEGSRCRCMACQGELPASSYCLPRSPIAEPHTMDGMLVKAMLGQSRARFAPDLAVVYGCLCSHVQLRWPRAGDGVEGKND